MTVTGTVKVGNTVYQVSAPFTLPPSTGWPDATNTGVPAGTVLRRVPQDVTSGPGWAWRTIGGEGVLDVNTPGAVLDALDVQGPIYSNGGTDPRSAIKATITRCRVRGVGEGNFILTVGPGSLVTDCDVGGGLDGTTYLGTLGILSGNYSKAQALTTFQRVNLHHCVQGFRQDGDTLIQDCYVHNVTMGEIAGAHSECVFISAGQNNTIRHCTMISGNSAVIFVQGGQTGNTAVNALVIDGNRVMAETRGGEQSSFGVSVENKSIGPVKPQVTNNVFDKTGWQVGAAQAPAGSVTGGNTYTDGSPVTVFAS